MRLRPGLRVLRRGATEVQVGTDPRWAVRITELTHAEADLMCLLDTDPDVDALLARARPSGVTTSRARDLVAALAAAHLTSPGPDRPGRLRACASAETSVWSLLREDGDGDAHVRARDARAVGIVGIGRVGLTTAVTLAAAGVGTILLDDDRTVTSVDVGAAGYRVGDVGSGRVLAANRVLRDVAPDVRTASPDGAPPDLIVVVEHDAAHPATALALVSAGITHLSVVVREADALVGPLVVPGDDACLRCLDLRRSADDDRWTTVLAQLVDATHPRGPFEREPAALAGVCGALAAAEVLAHLDGGTPRTRGAAYEVALPDVLPRLRRWAVHPDCGCTALPRPGAGGSPGNAP